MQTRKLPQDKDTWSPTAVWLGMGHILSGAFGLWMSHMFRISQETKVRLWFSCGQGNHEFMIFKRLKLHLCLCVWQGGGEERREEIETDKGDLICFFITVYPELFENYQTTSHLITACCNSTIFHSVILLQWGGERTKINKVEVWRVYSQLQCMWYISGISFYFQKKRCAQFHSISKCAP